MADVHLGRYTVICIGVAVCGIAHVVLVVGALPSVLQAGHGVAPFVIGILILACGAGKKTTFLLHSFHVCIVHTTWYRRTYL